LDDDSEFITNRRSFSKYCRLHKLSQEGPRVKTVQSFYKCSPEEVILHRVNAEKKEGVSV
jgi:hypothetical protein